MKFVKEFFSIFTTRIGRKIAAMILLVTLILFIPQFFSFRLESVFDETNLQVENENVVINHLDEMNAALRNEQISVHEMAFKQTPGEAAVFQLSATEVEAAYDEMLKHEDGELAGMPGEPDESATITELRELHTQVQTIVGTQIILGIQNSTADNATLKVAEDKADLIYNRMGVLNSRMHESFLSHRDAALLRQTESREFASEMMWASIVAALAAGLLIAGLYSRHLLKPVLRLAETMLKMARGDLSQRVEVKGRDEIAGMGGSFNNMAVSLERQTTQLVQEKARIRAIHQSIGDGIIVTDGSGAIISVNPAAERTLGRTVLELERTTNTGIPELQRVIAEKIPLANMVKCWEAKSCAKSDCPSHGSPDRRCWLQCGTFCYNQIQGTFKQKRDACERCDVFVKNAVIPFDLNIKNRLFSGQAVPILDDLGQEGGRTIVLHDVTDLRRAKQEAENSAAQLAVLNSVSRAAAGSLELDTIFDSSLARVIGGTMADAAFIHTWEAGGAEMLLAASQGLDDSFRALLAKLPPQTHGGGCPGHVVESGEAVLENNLDQLGAAAQAAIDAGFHSYVGAPLIVKKQIVGVVSLVAVEPDAFTRDDKHLLSMIGTKVGLAVDNARLFSKTVEYANQEQARNRIAATLVSSLEIESNFDEFAAALRELVDFDRISMTIMEADWSSIRAIFPDGTTPLLLDDAGKPRLMANTSVAWVMQHMRPFISGDLSQEQEKIKDHVKLEELGLRSLLNLPLFAKDKLLGTLNLANTEVGAYDEETIDKLQPVANQLSLTIANQRLFKDVARAKTEWETTFDSVSEGIAIVDTHYKVVRLNQAAADLVGGRMEELVGQSCHQVLHKLCEEPKGCPMNSAIFGAGPARTEQEFPDGRTLELVVDPMFDQEGRLQGAVHFFRDVTEAKKLRRQLVQSEKMIAVGQLVAGVAHEINNPLTGVTGYSQLLLARDLDERTRRDVEQINHEAERAGKIVRHLLSFARKHEPERRLADINQVVREALELKAYDLRVNNLVTDTKLANNLPVTAVDPHQLQQVFLNLIANAEQAMLDEAAGGGRLLISTETQDEMIRVVFTDSGPGISEEISDRVFDPFFTTKDVGKGTGLGLSVCYGILEEHGGKIWVDKSYSDGARMVVDLPVSSAVLNDVTTESEQPRTTQGRVGKILLVDDEAAIRDVVRKLLKRTGHRVDTARDGQVALRMLRQRHYDCVVTDVKMPGVDGTALHRAIRESDPRLAGTFIFISGDTVSPETREYLSETKRPYLAKPFKLEELESLLQQVLAGQSG